jgi:hypothetical protein
MTSPLSPSVMELAAIRQTFRYDERNGAIYRVATGAVATKMNTKGYLRVKLARREYLAHRVAWFLFYGEWPTKFIDHKNRDTADNNIGNLREADRTQNQANSRLLAANTSGKKGVTWHKHCQKWQAAIKSGGKNYHLGLFHDVESAHAAYMAAAEDKFGEFARSA